MPGCDKPEADSTCNGELCVKVEGQSGGAFASLNDLDLHNWDNVIGLMQ